MKYISVLASRLRLIDTYENIAIFILLANNYSLETLPMVPRSKTNN